MFMIPIAFVQIAISPTSLKKQQLELKNGYFFYNYGHIDSVSSDENPSPQINVDIRRQHLRNGKYSLPQPYLQVVPLIRNTSNVIVQVYILIRGYQEQDQLNEITTKDHSKFRNIDTRAYLIFCYRILYMLPYILLPYILLFLLLSQQFSSSQKCRTIQMLQISFLLLVTTIFLLL